MGGRRHVGEAAALVVVEDPAGAEVAGHEQVVPPVAVDVHELWCERGDLIHRQPQRCCGVDEVAVAVVEVHAAAVRSGRRVAVRSLGADRHQVRALRTRDLPRIAGPLRSVAREQRRVPLGDQQIEVAVMVDVVEGHPVLLGSEPDGGGCDGDPPCGRLIAEVAAAVVDEQLVDPGTGGCHVQIDAAVGVHVGECCSTRTLRRGGTSEARVRGGISEGAVTAVQVQEVRQADPGQEDVGPAVAVHVGHRGPRGHRGLAQQFAVRLWSAEACPGGDIGEAQAGELRRRQRLGAVGERDGRLGRGGGAHGGGSRRGGGVGEPDQPQRRDRQHHADAGHDAESRACTVGSFRWRGIGGSLLR